VTDDSDLSLNEMAARIASNRDRFELANEATVEQKREQLDLLEQAIAAVEGGAPLTEQLISYFVDEYERTVASNAQGVMGLAGGITAMAAIWAERPGNTDVAVDAGAQALAADALAMTLKTMAASSRLRDVVVQEITKQMGPEPGPTS
jgi:hypothetical protein